MSEPVLVVEGLDAYYESAHILQGVSFEMGEETVAVVGRNGMGKTTLCTAIMGLMPSVHGSVRGSIRFLGKEIVGRPPEAIAAAGIGYVPQGRRLFPSLSVDEHVRMIGGHDRGAWGAERSTSSSRSSPSGGGTAAPSSRAASSRCLRSRARCSRIRSC